jgi:hypothetical protein
MHVGVKVTDFPVFLKKKQFLYSFALLFLVSEMQNAVVGYCELYACLCMNKLPLNYVLQCAEFLLKLCSYSDCCINNFYVVSKRLYYFREG